MRWRTLYDEAYVAGLIFERYGYFTAFDSLIPWLARQASMKGQSWLAMYHAKASVCCIHEVEPGPYMVIRADHHVISKWEQGHFKEDKEAPRGYMELDFGKSRR